MGKDRTGQKGLIFNIQRYSIHDGPGIRTIVFFQGCPLRCPWCANPESQGAVKPVTWIKNGKKETISYWVTVDDVMNEVEKDEIFYRTSGGGLTLSGGECLFQYEFATNVLKAAKEMGISTAIETAGGTSNEAIKSVLPYTDEVLYDLKIMNPLRAQAVIGESVPLIKKNFETALAYPTAHVTPRVPLIPGYTTLPRNLEQIANYVLSLGIHQIHILPFHQFGMQKWFYLQRNYTMRNTPLLTDKQVKDMHDYFASRGITAVVSGLQ